MNPSNPWSGPYHTGAPIPDPRANTRVPSYSSNSTSPFTSTTSTSAQGSERRDGGPLMMNRKNKKQKEEGYEDRERINRAAVILGSRELLVFHGMGNDEVCCVLVLSCVQSLLSGESIVTNGGNFLASSLQVFRLSGWKADPAQTVPQTRLRFEKQLCGIENDDADDGAWVDVIEEEEDKGGKVGWGLDREERKGGVRKGVTNGPGGVARGKESERGRERGSGSRA